MRSSFKSVLWAALVLFVVSATAFAVPVTLTNPNFDDTDPGAGLWSFTLTGWTVEGTAGTFHPNAQITPLSAPNTAFLNNQAAISQILTGNTAAADTTYTLSVGVGARADGLPMGTWRLELYSGTTLLACVDSATTAPGQTGCTVSATDLPAAGGWNTATLMYTTASDLTGGDIGIRLASFKQADGQFADQVNFDNVTLDATAAGGGAVPEPMTVALTGCGLVGLAFLRRRMAHR